MIINEKILEELELKSIQLISEEDFNPLISFKYLNGEEDRLKCETGKHEEVIENHLNKLRTKIKREKLNKKLNKIKK